LTVAVVTACADVPAIYNVLRREGEKAHNEIRMLNGRQCVWCIYKHFASPNVSQRGLNVSCTVIDLTRAKLRDGDQGLVKYWDERIVCVSNIRRLLRRSEYQEMFADDVRKSDVMKVYVVEFDDRKGNDRNKTWGWLEMRGRIVFELDRERKNRRQARVALDGTVQDERKSDWGPEWAALAVNDFPRGNSIAIRPSTDPKGKGKRQGEGGKEGRKGYKGDADGNTSDSSFGSWSGKGARQPKNTTATPADEREQCCPCWCEATGWCVEGGVCRKAHRAMDDVGKAKVISYGFISSNYE
jgi:hypothetical protein